MTRERLGELIKEKADVYYVNLLQQKVVKYGLNETAYIGQNLETLNDELYFKGSCWSRRFEQLYETKEQAEYALRYQNIERVERLSLPTWEEVNDCDYGIEFGNDYYLETHKNGNIRVYSNFAIGEDVFYKPLTKENYLEACEICKKLFKGEKI